MPIRVQLDRILLDRRMSLTELADRVGVTLANLSILKTGKARAMRFSTLDALCRELARQIDVFSPFLHGRGRGIVPEEYACLLHDPLAVACMVDRRFVTSMTAISVTIRFTQR